MGKGQEESGTGLCIYVSTRNNEALVCNTDVGVLPWSVFHQTHATHILRRDELILLKGAPLTPARHRARIRDKADLKSILCYLYELIWTQWASGLKAVSVRKLPIEGNMLT